MKRIQIIQECIEKVGGKYVEIGLRDGHNFRSINCAGKYSVDPDKKWGADFVMRSRQFFDEVAGFVVYDVGVLFIDGDHEHPEPLLDLVGAILSGCMRRDGFIILHDTNPDNEKDTRPIAEFRDGEKWNGTAYVVPLCLWFGGLNYYTYPYDSGVTVIPLEGQYERLVEWSKALLKTGWVEPLSGEVLGKPHRKQLWQIFNSSKELYLKIKK